MEDSSGVAVLVPHSRGQQDTVFIPDRRLHDAEDQHGSNKSRLPTLLFRSLRSSARSWKSGPDDGTFSGRKRPLMTCASVPVPDSTEVVTPCKRSREQRDDCPTSSSMPGHAFEQEPLSLGTRTVTCYQCSMCRFISPTLELLKEHLLLMMSSTVTSSSCAQSASSLQPSRGAGDTCKTPPGGGRSCQTHPRWARDSISKERSPKVGSFEGKQLGIGEDVHSQEGGTALSMAGYRCLICNYECRQQRNLKTPCMEHTLAWLTAHTPYLRMRQTVLVPYKAPVLIWFQQVKRIP